MYKKIERIHFVGIGGVGMSGIAEVLKNLGYDVKGSDMKESETTKRLSGMGIHVNIGHKAEHVRDVHVVVVSSAVSSDNPEIVSARAKSIPVIPRAEMLAELARLKYGVLIAGAHGKTTVTSLVASVLASGGLDPTVVIGGKLKGIGSNAKLGEGEFLVAEADESDGSFLRLAPTIAVVTNIDREHMDFFKDIYEVKKAFLLFANKVPFYGLSILCGDDKYIKELLPEVRRRFFTYGLSEGMNLVARNIRADGLKSEFEAVLEGESLGIFEAPLIGGHNICNCLAAIAVAVELEINIKSVKEALSAFSGVQRRFELKGMASGIRVIDDYGHHPTEIKATLRAAKTAVNQGSGYEKGRLVVLFQPHRYSRTRDLLGEFSDAFVDADKVILMDIYAAGEMPINGVNSEVLLNGIKDAGKDVEYIKERADVVKYLADGLKSGDTLLTLGAGDVWKIGEEVIKRLED
jgi:UDP-N-acetylmuramate--alanine ligase